MTSDKRSSKNSREELYTLFQSIEGIAWEADTGMQQFTFISDKVEPVLGFSPEACMNTPGLWRARIHPDDKHVVTDYLHLKNQPEKKYSFEYRMIHADDQIVWIKDNVTIVYKDGQPFLLRGIMVDNTITEKLRAQERLESDMLRLNSDLTVSLQQVLCSYLRGLEALFPKMQCSIHRVKNGRLTGGMSPSLPSTYMAAVAGIPIGEYEGSCGAAAISKQQVIVSDIANDARWVKFLHLAGKYHLGACWSTPVIDTDGEVMATLAMYYREAKIPYQEEMKVMERATALLRIILENRQKAEIISEANLLMLQSQELAHFGNWRWDVQHDIVTWSPALYTIYGLDPKDFKATFDGYQELLHPDDRVQVCEYIENVFKTKVDVEFEERIIRPNGEVRHLRSWAKLKSDADGVPLEMIGACLDVTERVNHIVAIEQQSQQLTEIGEQNARMIKTLHALEQSHADNTRMMKVVAHDLRNPIGAIKMTASALMVKPDRLEKERKMLEIIYRSATNSLELVNDLLQMQGRQEDLQKEPVELGAMLFHCTDLLRHQAEAKQQQIRLDVLPVIILSSREKLWRVISNLIANAIKFSSQGTTIKVSLKTKAKHVVIAIADQGIGIPESMKDCIFEIFPGSQRSGTAGEPSFGLGLVICRQIVEAHQGKIWFESQLGKGTTFFVQLPIK
ncbi:PAS domain-containing protein [Mucilaginibacter frigoritolerans]|nr:PAS domain-containing protein [Mucilaginibacter frigoritolerans]